ncbi:hypothetical protein O3P69_009145 [Scylla paramamosain]|uniref:Uncharacterized protein n=1 Tax=Scylla paramamosain TaxID=85552 RepID=A0AAW0T9D6_SCYPA
MDPARPSVPPTEPCHTPSGRTTTPSNMHDAYENLLTVQGLKDHVTFPTHERGGTLDPVISDLEEDTLSCRQLGLVGSSDHHAVLTQVDMGVARDEVADRRRHRQCKLDGIQRRALRLVEAAGAPAHPEAPVDTLEHRRDVAALVMFHKAQVENVPTSKRKIREKLGLIKSDSACESACEAVSGNSLVDNAAAAPPR